VFCDNQQQDDCKMILLADMWMAKDVFCLVDKTSIETIIGFGFS
jgi:hypothetical protein